MTETNTPNTPDDIQNLNQNFNMQEFVETFSSQFADQYARFMSKFAGQNWLNPIYANDSMKRMNSYPNRPTTDNIIKWMNNPKHFEQQLRGCSEFLYYSSQYYQRSISYVANILNFDYELIPINLPTDTKIDKKTISLYKRQKALNNDWLRKFRVKEQCSNVMLDVARSGGNCYYLRQSDEGDYLMPLPQDYVYVNGRTDVLGFTYSMNMAFFRSFPSSIEGFAPEFYDWYQEFLNQDKIANQQANPYRMMPYDKAYVIKWDDTRPEMIPPFSGVYKNALEIEEYSDLLKLRTTLQTYMMLFFEVPKDNDNKPTMAAGEVMNYLALIQSMLPSGIGAIASPMSLSNTNFSPGAQTMNNIIGLGSSNYYESSGLTPALFGADTKSAVGIANSIHTDYLMCEHMFDQFERIINFNLAKIQGKFNFAIKFLRRSNFKIEEDKQSALTLLQSGGPVSRVLSAYGMEPWQHEQSMLDNSINGLYDLLKPPMTSFTMSPSKDKGGRPTAEQSGNPISDSNDATRQGSHNEGKFSQKKCLNCDQEINPNNNLHGIFCNEDCQMEFAQNIVDENN